MWDKYLAGGQRFEWNGTGVAFSGNLTPDPETGIGKRTDDELKRVLKSGVSHDGRVIDPFMMPWSAWSNWTDEDRYAVVVYLRNIKPVRHKVPDFSSKAAAQNQTQLGSDFAIHESRPR